MSEIDDIFAGKAKAKASVSAPKPIPSASNPPRKKDKKKKKKKKDTDAVPGIDASPEASSWSKKRPAPETVVDTSHHLSGPSKRHKGDQPQEVVKPSKSCIRKTVAPDAAFKHSRDRKTEEGWRVYKEDELGIGDEGGDTPLCPFDCDCCF